MMDHILNIFNVLIDIFCPLLDGRFRHTFPRLEQLGCDSDPKKPVLERNRVRRRDISREIAC